MIFNAFVAAVEEFPDNLALNNLTYKELLREVLNTEYSPVCYETDYSIIIHILVAAKMKKPIVILPKFHRDDVKIPNNLPEGFNIILYSSGSSGPRKEICLPDAMIYNNALTAIEVQNITANDSILTVCSLNHTGGINAQTIAGLLSGSHIVVDQFNAFKFLKNLKDYKITLTHLIPVMIDALIKTKSSIELDDLRLVVAGSDCVYKHHVEFWINKRIKFMSNYGMTEAGPIIINHIYQPGDNLTVFDLGVPLGDNVYSEYKIENNELFLKGKNISVDGWFATGDCVKEVNQWIYYQGRKSAGCKIIPKKY
jgi:long-subunit acyl-CoA synthetase (AMP-forming)